METVGIVDMFSRAIMSWCLPWPFGHGRELPRVSDPCIQLGGKCGVGTQKDATERQRQRERQKEREREKISG